MRWRCRSRCTSPGPCAPHHVCPSSGLEKVEEIDVSPNVCNHPRRTQVGLIQSLKRLKVSQAVLNVETLISAPRKLPCTSPLKAVSTEQRNLIVINLVFAPQRSRGRDRITLLIIEDVPRLPGILADLLGRRDGEVQLLNCSTMSQHVTLTLFDGNLQLSWI